MQNKKNKTRKLTQMALLTAIILLMAFTPLGVSEDRRSGDHVYHDPSGGRGDFDGARCRRYFGRCIRADELYPVLWHERAGGDATAGKLVSYVRRMLCAARSDGLAGRADLKALYKVDKTRLVSFAVASLSGAVLNTIFFVGSLGLLFYNTVLGMAAESGISVLAFLLSFVTLNSVLECAACLIVGTAISKALYKSFGSIKER